MTTDPIPRCTVCGDPVLDGDCYYDAAARGWIHAGCEKKARRPGTMTASPNCLLATARRLIAGGAARRDIAGVIGFRRCIPCGCYHAAEEVTR